MKKIIKKLAAVVSCFAILLVAGVSLTACGKKEEPTPPPATGTITFSSSESIGTAISTVMPKLTALLDKENTDGEIHKHQLTDTEFFGEDGLTEAEYFVEFATLSGFDSITKVKIGSQEFGTEDVNVSLGNNHFIQSKAWKVENGKLYVAYPVFNFEVAAGLGVVTINGVTATIPTEETPVQLPTKAFNNAYAVFAAPTSNSTVTPGETANNVLNVTINLKDGKQAVALEYGDSENVDTTTPALVKTVKNGNVMYALTKNNTVNDKVVLGVYPVVWSDSVDDVQTEYAAHLNKTLEVTAFVNGSFYRANILITATAN